MPVQKKSLISKTTVKKTQSASQEQPESNELKANSLAAHSMKKKRYIQLHKAAYGAKPMRFVTLKKQ